MQNIEPRIKHILSQLAEVQRELTALSDDIWLSIDHNDNEALKSAVAFKTAYNNKVSELHELREDISHLIHEFTAQAAVPIDHRQIVTEPDPPEKVRPLPRPFTSLDEQEKHFLDESFTDTRPTGFTIEGKDYAGIRTWRELYLKTITYLQAHHPAFDGVKTAKAFVSKRGHKMFTDDKKELREAAEIHDGLFTEINLSANHIRDNIKLLLDYFEIEPNQFIIYLRKKRQK